MPHENADIGYTCLNCGQVTIPPNRDSIDNWSCGYCHSGFISFAMLSNLAPRELMRELRRKGKKDGKSRPCPQCYETMERLGVHFNSKDLVLDICRHCHLLWFDSGELMRTLRHRQPEPLITSESESEAILKGQLRRGVRAPHPKPDTTPIFLPVLTYALVAVCILIMPMAAHRNDLYSIYGFNPSYPLRAHALTWLSSLLLHESVGVLLQSMFLLLMVGGYLEEKMGRGRYLRLLLTAGLMGRFSYLLSASGRDPIYVGTTSALCGLMSYGALTFPWRRVLFPTEHRWRSPANVIAWCCVLAVSILGVYLGWNFFAVAFHKVAHGRSAALHTDTFLAGLQAWIASPHFRAQLGGAAIGVLWALVDSMSRLSPRTRPAATTPR